MNKLAATFVASLCFFVADNAKADFLSNTFTWDTHVGWLHIGPDDFFNVKIFDGVSDGCWTNSDAVKTAVELELKRSGYNLANSDEERVLAREVYISSNGFALETESIVTGCAANYELGVTGFKKETFASNGHVVEGLFFDYLWRKGGLMTGDKESFDARLKEQYVDLIQKFLVTIDVKKREALEAIRGAAKGEAKEYWENYKLN